MSTTKQETIEQKEAWFLQAMGCSEGTLQRMISRSRDNLSMLSMGILSDAQELLHQPENPKHVPQLNAARQLMNRAKYVIGKQQDRQRFLDRAKPDVDTDEDSDDFQDWGSIGEPS